MVFKPGQDRPANAGRKKGTPNKTTRVIKTILAEILEEPKSEQKLRELRDSAEPSDRATFWRIAGKLVPSEVAAEIRGMTVKLVDLSDQRKDGDDGLAEG